MAVSVPHLSCQHDSASAATLHRASSTKRHPHLVMGNRGLGPSAGGLSGWPAAGLAHRRQHRPNNRSRCTTTACSDATNTVHTAKPMGTKYSSPVAWRGVSGVRARAVATEARELERRRPEMHPPGANERTDDSRGATTRERARASRGLETHLLGLGQLVRFPHRARRDVRGTRVQCRRFWKIRSDGRERRAFHRARVVSSEHHESLMVHKKKLRRPSRRTSPRASTCSS